MNFHPASSRGGENYGWNVLEGSQCLQGGCSADDGLTPPLLEYDRSQGCAVIGGYVYRGRRAAGSSGAYIYADHCSGNIWGLRREAGGWGNRLLLSSGLVISALGEDEAGEIYLTDFFAGDIYVVSESNPSGPPGTSARGLRVESATNAASKDGGRSSRTS